MPLSAILDGERVISTRTSEEEWETLKHASRDRSLLMAWSGEPCYPRVSKTGLRHFAHYPGTDTGNLTWHETLEHLTLKDLVVQTAIELGWEARTEVPASDRSWIADTLLTKDHETIAIEIQWSRQSDEQYRYRQDRYKKAGIQCYWIARHSSPLWENCDNLIPIPRFRIMNPDEVLVEKPHIEVDDKSLDFKDFLSRLLAGEIRLGQIRQLQATPCEWCRDWCTRWTGMPENFTSKDREMARQYNFPPPLQKRGQEFYCFRCGKHAIWTTIDTSIDKPFALLEYWYDTSAIGAFWGLEEEDHLEKQSWKDVLQMRTTRIAHRTFWHK